MNLWNNELFDKILHNFVYNYGSSETLSYNEEEFPWRTFDVFTHDVFPYIVFAMNYVVSTLFDSYHELLNNNFKYFFGTTRNTC